jgi:hypothetical protein
VQQFPCLAEAIREIDDTIRVSVVAPMGVDRAAIDKTVLS